MENPRIQAHLVSASEFPELSERYQVGGVPHTVIDGTTTIQFVGRYPEQMFVQELMKALA